MTTVARPNEAPLMQMIFRALHNTGLQPPPGEAPTFEPLSDPERLSSAFEEAGFREVTVERASVPWVVKDAKEFWHRWGTVAPPVRRSSIFFPRTDSMPQETSLPSRSRILRRRRSGFPDAGADRLGSR